MSRKQPLEHLSDALGVRTGSRVSTPCTAVTTNNTGAPSVSTSTGVATARLRQHLRGRSGNGRVARTRSVPYGPILELTASHLLGDLAQEMGALSLPVSSSALSPTLDEGVAVPRDTWPESLVVEDSCPPLLPVRNPPPAPVRSELSLEQPAGSSLIRAFDSANSQEELDRIVALLVSQCSALNKVRPPTLATTTRRAPPDIASLPPKAVQRFYGKNRKRSFEQITGHKSPSLEIPIQILGDALGASMGTAHHHNAQEILVKGEEPDHITGESIDPAEVVLRLAKAANSAPSPLDRLTYQHLKRFDAEGRVLAALFNACFRTGLTPTQWRAYVTILIYKRPKEPNTAEAANPKNWRPIALLPTISKVFTGIIADRLSTWASRVAAISPSQKGCYSGEGCLSTYKCSQH